MKDYIYIANVWLFAVSFLYLWLPNTFKVFGYIWFHYSLAFLKCSFVLFILFIFRNNKYFQMIMMIGNLSRSGYSYSPEYWVKWDRVNKHYIRLVMVEIIYLLIIWLWFPA